MHRKKKRITAFAAAVSAAFTLMGSFAVQSSAALIQTVVGYRGDVTLDMQVTAEDARLLSQYLTTDCTLSTDQALYADMNQDGRLDAVDYVLLKRIPVSGEKPAEVYTEKEVEEKLMEPPVKVLKPALPSQDNVRILMVAIDFPNCKFEENYSTEQIHELVFGAENKNSPSYPLDSVSAYYERASYGRLHIEGDVFAYSASANIESYNDKKDILVEEVLGALDSQIDYSVYDTNQNGEIDAMIFSLPASADQDYWWPCSDGYYGRKRYDNVRASRLLIGGWSMTDTGGFISTWTHELGHAMGLPDYYKYENYTKEDYHGLLGDAGYLMMDYAFGDMSCFDKMMYGWYTESEVKVYTGGTQTFYLRSSQEAPNCILIPRTQDGGLHSEYFMLEYATPVKNNQGDFQFNWWIQPTFKEGGIRILHCDAEIFYGKWGLEFKWNNYGFNYDNSNQRQRVLRLVNNGGGFFKTGAVVNNATKGFQWYDTDGYETVNPNLNITIGECKDGVYTVTISE